MSEDRDRPERDHPSANPARRATLDEDKCAEVVSKARHSARSASFWLAPIKEPSCSKNCSLSPAVPLPKAGDFLRSITFKRSHDSSPLLLRMAGPSQR